MNLTIYIILCLLTLIITYKCTLNIITFLGFLYLIQGLVVSMYGDTYSMIFHISFIIAILVLMIKNKLTFIMQHKFYFFCIVVILIQNIIIYLYSGNIESIQYGIIYYVGFPMFAILYSLKIVTIQNYKNSYLKQLICIATISAMIGIIRYYFSSDFFGLYHDLETRAYLELNRASDFSSSSIVFGPFLALVSGMIIGLIVEKKHKKYHYVCLIVLLLGVFVSNSRAAWMIAFFEIIIGYIMNLVYSKQSSYKKLFKLFFLIILLLIACIVLNELGVFDRQLAQLQSFDFSIRINTFNLYTEDSNYIGQLMGIGAGSIGRKQKLLTYDNFILVENYYLILLIELGIFSALSELYLLFHPLIYIILKLRKSKNKKYFIIPILGIMIFLAVMQFTATIRSISISLLTFTFLYTVKNILDNERYNNDEFTSK